MTLDLTPIGTNGLGSGNGGQTSELNSKEGAGHGHDASTGAVTTETVLGRPTTKSESTRAFNGRCRRPALFPSAHVTKASAVLRILL